jgi:hypothetical protein
MDWRRLRIFLGGKAKLNVVPGQQTAGVIEGRADDGQEGDWDSFLHVRDDWCVEIPSDVPVGVAGLPGSGLEKLQFTM